MIRENSSYAVFDFTSDHLHGTALKVFEVPGGLETRYSCCEAVLGLPGCQVAKLHVRDQRENLEGFVKTFVKFPPSDGNHSIFAVNCEVCYTAKGLELTRVTVVDPSLQVVYDTFVKPDEEVINYNTRFSGVVEDDLKNTETSVLDVQAFLLNLFSTGTESDTASSIVSTFLRPHAGEGEESRGPKFSGRKVFTRSSASETSPLKLSLPP
ncbi:putative exonuclease GOR [Vicugna pacos]|uniref:Exonuclease GOR n=1 Tax=Vicugna pacos TaxID=30538 RepID=A0ABM5D755_VICPA